MKCTQERRFIYSPPSLYPFFTTTTFFFFFRFAFKKDESFSNGELHVMHTFFFSLVTDKHMEHKYPFSTLIPVSKHDAFNFTDVRGGCFNCFRPRTFYSLHGPPPQEGWAPLEMIDFEFSSHGSNTIK